MEKRHIFSVGVCGVALLAGILGSGPGKIDHRKVETAITDGLKANGITMRAVTCPADMPLKQGAGFQCTGIDPDGQNITFNVTEKDNHGTVEWTLVGTLVDEQEVTDLYEPKFSAIVHKTIDIQCPKKRIIAIKGTRLTCDATVNGAPATINGKLAKVECNFIDDIGNINCAIR